MSETKREMKVLFYLAASEYFLMRSDAVLHALMNANQYVNTSDANYFESVYHFVNELREEIVQLFHDYNAEQSLINSDYSYSEVYENVCAILDIIDVTESESK